MTAAYDPADDNPKGGDKRIEKHGCVLFTRTNTQELLLQTIDHAFAQSLATTLKILGIGSMIARQ